MRKEEPNTIFTWEFLNKQGGKHGARVENFYQVKKLQNLSLNIRRVQLQFSLKNKRILTLEETL